MESKEQHDPSKEKDKGQIRESEFREKDDALDETIADLCDPAKINDSIAASKKSASTSLWSAIVLFILSLAVFVVVIVFARCDCPAGKICEPQSNTNACCACQYQPCHCYDSIIYGFLGITALTMICSILAIKSYQFSTKMAVSLYKEYSNLNDIKLAWQISKSLPVWIESDPERTEVKRPCGKSDKKKDDEKKDDENKRSGEVADVGDNTETLVVKGKEYNFPQQRARLQIIETLLSRSSS